MTTAETTSTRRAGLLRSTARRTAVLVALVVLLVLIAVWSLFVGSGSITAADVVAALQHGGTDTTSLLVRDFRVPRTILALLVGTGLGLAGALIQTITRNPLADPGILGVNSGAYLAVVLAVSIFGVTGITAYVWWSFGGAVVVAVAVYLIGARGRAGATPVRLVLAGVAISYLLNGISLALTLRDPEAFDRIRFWQAGSLQSRQLDTVLGILPFLAVGILLALLLMTSLNVTALGDDLARSLGASVLRTRILAFVAITILCGAATAAAGPIAFLGLMAPYVARAFVGPDQRWVIPFTAVIAPIIFVLSDMLGRVLLTSEVPVGLVSAVIGAPLLIILIRRTKARGL